MPLVWTYDAKSKNLTDKERTILLNYYILSINSAKKLGYYTIMVCNPNEVHFWQKYVNEVRQCYSYEDSPLWDSFKMYAIENIGGTYYLIDGDVILHKKLPELHNDIVFDSYEILNWTNEYKPTIDTLTKLGIADYISIWNSNRISIMNCGILGLNNPMIKLLYLNNWKIFNKFVINNIEKIETKFATGVGAQYLLSLIVNRYNINTIKLTENLGIVGEYYKHHYGSQKYTSPIVPIDSIIPPNDRIKLF